MNVTVAEALTIVCPMTRNRVNMPDQLCLGNDCMAWRWWEPQKGADPQKGYCGLADRSTFYYGQAGGT